jgi:hypothetical protein
MNDEGGCIILIAILVAVAIAVTLIIYVVLPITVFLLGGIGIVGAVSGAVVAVRNFSELLVEAHQTLK